MNPANEPRVFGLAPSTIRRVLLADGWHTVAQVPDEDGWSFTFDATGGSAAFASFLDEVSGRWVHTRPTNVLAVEEGTDEEHSAAVR